MSASALKLEHRDSGRVNLLGLAPEELVEFFESLGQKPYRARQIMRWVYQRRVLDFAAMTDLSLSLRERLHAGASLQLPPAGPPQRSADGTRKWLVGVGGGQAVETVFIPEPNRGTLCISSQAGCVLDCAFCATGHQGFNRNLSAAEIIGQVMLAAREVGAPVPGEPERPTELQASAAPQASADSGAPPGLTNIVFMGMGEPLANYRNVVPVVRLLVDDRAFGLSRRRVTISTAGLVPQILRLAEECNVALAVSLHAPTDALRDELVPINRVHPIGELLEACWTYAKCLASRQITFEYVLLEGVNDSPEQARQLARLLRDRPAKVNLIPFNSFPGSDFRCSSPEVVERFWRTVRDAGVVVTVRRPRGDDIAAACGQLAGKVNDRRRVRLRDKALGVRAQ